MPKKRKPASSAVVKVGGYEALLSDVIDLLERARHGAARVVNSVMTTTYWHIGMRIVEHEQGGSERSEYGSNLLGQLSKDLNSRIGRGFSVDNLESMRSFYLAYRPEYSEMASRKSRGKISETASRNLDVTRPQGPVAAFPLPWSHYVRLLSVKDPDARKFYESEALRGGWTVKQLDRQANSSFYERTMLSKNKAAMLTKHNRARREDDMSVDEQIKDPFVLEFLGLKDEYSESQLEEALTLQVEQFLLELGGDFAFIGRQRRLRVGDAWYRVDLVFFHRRLRCLLVIDLKVGKFTHADAGQMHLYLNYAQENRRLFTRKPGRRRS